MRQDSPRNIAENIIGKEALAALDNLGIGVYSRELLLIKQRHMVNMARILAMLSTHPCPLGKIARRINQKTLIPVPTAGVAHKNIVCCRFGRDIRSKALIAHKKIPTFRLARRNCKCAHVRSVCESHNNLP